MVITSVREVFGHGFSSEKNYTQERGYEKTVEAASQGLLDDYDDDGEETQE